MSEKRDEGAELYARYLGGEKEAFDGIIGLYHDCLIYFVCGMVHNFADAEDVAADTFCELLVRGTRFARKSSLKTYLFSVARNKSVDLVRKSVRSRDKSSETESDQADAAMIEEAVIRDERAKAVRDGLLRINADYAQVLSLYYIDGFSPEEIGRIMKKNKRQVSNLLYRGKEALKKALAEMGVTEF